MRPTLTRAALAGLGGDRGAALIALQVQEDEVG
jgi:hypothetical protein